MELKRRMGRRLVGVVVAAAMLLVGGAVTASAAADEPKEFAAGSDTGVMKALEQMQALNELRQSSRTPLTPEQIARANREDAGSDMTADQVAANTADGKPVPALNVNWDLMRWAQTRADELAEAGKLDAHANMLNGKPDWYAQDEAAQRYNLTESDQYESGCYFFGPEALASRRAWTTASDGTEIPSGYSGDAVQLWAAELTATASEKRQGYGHYLTEVSPLANIAGMGVAVKNGVTITVLEIGYTDGTQPSQTVDEAIAEHTPQPQPVSVDPVTATVFAGRAPGLPDTVTVRYDDGSAKELAVTWEDHDWSSQGAGTVNLTGAVEGTALQASAVVTVKARNVVKVDLSRSEVTVPSTRDSAEQAVNDALAQVTATVTYDGGVVAEGVRVDWNDLGRQQLATVRNRNGGSFTVTGTAAGGKVSVNVIVTPATVVSYAAPTGFCTQTGVVPQIFDLNPVTVRWSNGEETSEFVHWNLVEADFMSPGEVEVHGTLDDGTDATMKITVADVIPVRLDAYGFGTRITTATHAPDIDHLQAGVIYSDGTIEYRTVDWEDIDPALYAKDQVGKTFTVTGAVRVGDWERKVTVDIQVVARQPRDWRFSPSELTIPSGTNPNEMLKHVTATLTYDTGEVETVPVRFNEVGKDIYARRDGGSFSLSAYMGEYSGNFPLYVDPAYLTGVQSDFGDITVVQGVEPVLPALANVEYSNGDKDVLPVTWDVQGTGGFAQVGDYRLTGSVKGWEGNPDQPQVTVHVVLPTVVTVSDPKGITVESGIDVDKLNLPATAKAVMSDGSKADVSVKWDALTDAQKRTLNDRRGGEFTVSGSVVGTDKTVSLKVTVRPATVVGAGFGEGDDPTEGYTPFVMVESGTDPSDFVDCGLPATARVLWSNGEITDEAVDWNLSLTDEQKATLNGHMSGIVGLTGTVRGLSVAANIGVKHVDPLAVLDDDLIKNYQINLTVNPGETPQLPATAQVKWANGDISTQPLTWQMPDSDRFFEEGATILIVGNVDASVQAVDGGYGAGFGINAYVTVNKVTQPLRDALSKAEALNAADYTAESWAAVQSAMGYANKVLQDANSTAVQKTEARQLLEDAMKGLDKAGQAGDGDQADGDQAGGDQADESGDGAQGSGGSVPGTSDSDSGFQVEDGDGGADADSGDRPDRSSDAGRTESDGSAIAETGSSILWAVAIVVALVVLACAVTVLPHCRRRR